MREFATSLMHTLQDEICAALLAVEDTSFREDQWAREEGGGGRSRVIQDGSVLEKAGVNVSAVWGELPVDAARAAGTMSEAGGARFFATGVSVVVHPRNPYAPTAHCNVRYFERGDGSGWWVGGGADLTPYYLFDEDAREFHRALKAACDGHDRAYYPRFKRWCDEYFFLPHRGEARGVGGIFFDDLHGRPREQSFGLLADVARAFARTYPRIVARRLATPFGERERFWQEVRRGRYAEFNLVYDRGTTFGLRTGGRTESILMSLPPTVRWVYDHLPAADSAEARLLEVVRRPREWA